VPTAAAGTVGRLRRLRISSVGSVLSGCAFDRVAHLPGQGCLALGGGGVRVSVDACVPLVPGPQLGTERIVSGPADLLAVFVEEISAEWGGDLL